LKLQTFLQRCLVANQLNQYLTEMSKVAVSHGATIDKYVGDAVMGFFGDPASRGSKEDAIACVKMAIAMQQRMRGARPRRDCLEAEKVTLSFRPLARLA